MKIIKVIKACIDQKENILSYYFSTKECVVSMKALNINPVKCPICGKCTFDSWHICRECGWEYDTYGEIDMFEESSANHCCAYDYKMHYEALNIKGGVRMVDKDDLITLQELDEKFRNEEKRQRHYEKHVTEDGRSKIENPHGRYDDEFTTYEFPDPETYEDRAEELARKFTDGKRIEAFVDIYDRVHKYDIVTGEFVMYELHGWDDCSINSYYLMTPERWSRDLRDAKARDLTPEEL